jgi:hypothetical protein
MRAWWHVQVQQLVLLEVTTVFTSWQRQLSGPRLDLEDAGTLGGLGHSRHCGHGPDLNDVINDDMLGSKEYFTAWKNSSASQ